jgi:eukaryotic-like serine/threonine-protein kinase
VGGIALALGFGVKAVQTRFRLGEVLGRGGMGEVVSAYDTTIGRDVAIKSLLAPNPTPLAVRRFLREARIQGRLDHPAIVPVHELAYDKHGNPYFVMKKLSGTTLSELLTSGAATTSRHKLLHGFVDVCLAIEFAHSRGVVHRDLKPSNIVLGDFGEVYVLDWGIARAPTDRNEPCGEPRPAETDKTWEARAGINGTVGYMAPEQLAGERVDERADVYSLGCVLFELLTGEQLHPRGDAAASTVAGVIDARPSLRVAGIAPELDALCVRSTALDREQRPRSARELGAAVQRYLDGDRDLEQRHRLACAHLETARAAVDQGDGEPRQIAMRELGKALALDPTLEAAAALLGQLMLEPLAHIPAPAAAELVAIDQATSQQFTRNLIAVHSPLLITMLAMWCFGVRDVLYLVLGVGVTLTGLSFAAIELTTGRSLARFHHVVLVLMFALTARIFTPFLVAPGIVAVNVIAFAFHPSGTRLRIFLSFAVAAVVAVLGVFALEVIGVLTPTTTWVGGALVLRSPVAGMENFPCPAALCVYLVTLTVMSALLAFAVAKLGRTARERVHIKAWQIRQVIAGRVDGVTEVDARATLAM